MNRKTVIVVAPTNWNSDPIVESLAKLKFNVKVFCLRRKKNLPKIKDVQWIRPPISFILMALHHFVINKIFKNDIYQSLFFGFCIFIFELEIIFFCFLRNIKPYTIFGWANCSLFVFKFFKKKSILNLFTGNSHIDQLSKVLLRYSNIKVNKIYKIKHKLEYILSDCILVESEYCKSTFIKEKKNIKVLDIPIPETLYFDKKNYLFQNKPIVGKLRLGFIASRKIKGLHISKEIISKLKKINLPISFFVFADKNNNQISKNKDTTFYPKLTQSEFLKCLKSLDIICIPTLEDGGPRVAIESIILGTFVIGSKFSKIPELEKLGLAKTIKHNRSEEYVELIKSLKIKSIRINRIKRKKVAKDNFNSKKLTKCISQLI